MRTYDVSDDVLNDLGIRLSDDFTETSGAKHGEAVWQTDPEGGEALTPWGQSCFDACRDVVDDILARWAEGADHTVPCLAQMLLAEVAETPTDIEHKLERYLEDCI